LHIERDYLKAEEVISPLVDQFPGHPYFAFLKGEFLAKTNQWEALDELLPELREFASKGPFLQQNECQLKLAYVEGLESYHKKDYSTAISKCNWILTNYHMELDWLKGFAYFLRAQSFGDLGQMELAVKDYKEVLKMDSYYPEVEEARENIERIASKE
jgi:tetratricopeptide (TPR) repeat protein